MDSPRNKISPQISNSESNDIKIQKTNFLDTTFKKILFFLFIGLIVVGLILLIILLVIYGAYPCINKKCHPNAICINRPFYADCQCKYGFNGNGIDCDECGLTFNKNNAVILGNVAIPNSWPATVDILFNYRTSYSVNEDEEYLLVSFNNCGGTLINRKTVLTTASCIRTSIRIAYKNTTIEIPVKTNDYHSDIESMYTVYVGAVNQINLYNNIYPAKHSIIEKIIKHDSFDPLTRENDLALIKLRDKIELNDKVQLSCLPNLKDISDNFPAKTNEFGWAAGWGSINVYRPLNVELKNIILNIYNISMCNNILKIKEDQLGKYAFCAGEYNNTIGNGKTGNCHGDYGGSLYIEGEVNGKNKFITAGILSYNDECKTPHSPGIYTNLIHYLDWIDENSEY